MINNLENNLAKQCSETMHANDSMARASGMQIKSSTPGEAQVLMTITKSMLNGHGRCHGGMIFSLADTAFAHACNNENKANVAMDCRIDFLRPAFENDDLTARATKKHAGKSTGLYEVQVINQEGKDIALFQGRSFAINQSVINKL
jgi:acyl-CoA thioesterase